MKTYLLFFFMLVMSFGALGQTDDQQWPSLNYLRRDYRSVVAVAHVRVREAEISIASVAMKIGEYSAKSLSRSKVNYIEANSLSFTTAPKRVFEKNYSL